jgi:hypothetical protein
MRSTLGGRAIGASKGYQRGPDHGLRTAPERFLGPASTVRLPLLTSTLTEAVREGSADVAATTSNSFLRSAVTTRAAPSRSIRASLGQTPALKTSDSFLPSQS